MSSTLDVLRRGSFSAEAQAIVSILITGGAMAALHIAGHAKGGIGYVVMKMFCLFLQYIMILGAIYTSRSAGTMGDVMAVIILMCVTFLVGTFIIRQMQGKCFEDKMYGSFVDIFYKLVLKGGDLCIADDVRDSASIPDEQIMPSGDLTAFLTIGIDDDSTASIDTNSQLSSEEKLALKTQINQQRQVMANVVKAEEESQKDDLQDLAQSMRAQIAPTQPQVQAQTQVQPSNIQIQQGQTGQIIVLPDGKVIRQQ